VERVEFLFAVWVSALVCLFVCLCVCVYVSECLLEAGV
jgi:hypothetical protein